MDFPLSILDQIGREDIEEYMEYLSYYVKDGVEYMNDERGRSGSWPLCAAFITIFTEMS